LIRAKINLTLYIKKIYGNFTPLRTMKNEPKTNPNKPNLPEGKIDAKCVVTKDYEEKCG